MRSSNTHTFVDGLEFEVFSWLMLQYCGAPMRKHEIYRGRYANQTLTSLLCSLGGQNSVQDSNNLILSKLFVLIRDTHKPKDRSDMAYDNEIN